MFVYLFGHGQVLPILLIVVAFVATLYSLGRTLPLQNVLAITAIIIIISTVIAAIGEKLGFPFGPFFYTENLGPTLLYLVPWPVPALWLVAVLNSRGVARLTLRPWRDAPNFGFRVLALTCLLAVLFDALLEPYAARTQHFWIWQNRNPLLAWYGAPWINFIAWPAVTLLLLGCATPWLIIKKPVTNPPPDFSPLILWLTLTGLLTLANTTQHLWPATLLGLLTIAATTTVALRNCNR